MKNIRPSGAKVTSHGRPRPDTTVVTRSCGGGAHELRPMALTDRTATRASFQAARTTVIDLLPSSTIPGYYPAGPASTAAGAGYPGVTFRMRSWPPPFEVVR